MAQFVTLIAVGKWANRENLNYVPCNEKINGCLYNAFGIPISQAGNPAEVRRPYRLEENGTTSYVQYDDDSRVDTPIYKTVEV